MNGFISETPSRSPNANKPSIISTVILGSCLLGGFASGINVTPSALAAMNPFRTETLQFGKISWISHPANDGIKIVEIDHSLDPVVIQNEAETVTFVPFELRAEQMRRFHLRSLTPGRSNFKKLSLAMQQVTEATHYDAFSDYQIAITRIRGEFALALNETPAPLPPQIIAMTSSSAEAISASVIQTPPILSVPQKAHALLQQDLYPAPVIAKRPYTPMLAPESNISVKAEMPTVALNTQAVSIQKETYLTATENASTGALLDAPKLTTSSELTRAEQEKLTNELLAVQLSTQAKKPYYTLTQRETIREAKVVPTRNLSAEDLAAIKDKSETEHEAHAFVSKAEPTVKADGKNCERLSSHVFSMATTVVPENLANQICDGEITWISNPSRGSSWVKLAADSFFPTLTLNPAPNAGSTLLLDQNGLGLIAIKSGVHVTKGMGVVVGLVPDDFKVSFIGRAEETEYFDANGKKYFAILNAEPGAGVVEVAAKANPNLSTTVFTPVLEDTITYLDLATPVAQDLKIKVVKNGTENDPEVAKLTVGMSTQSAIQAITRADGQTVLKSVNLIPGFPVFIDVSSHTSEAEGFTYRYELKRAQPSGVFVVNEVSEKTIRHWLKQVKQGLSDQSAMVVGFFDRARLDGFKNPHTTKVVPLTAKFGLEPINYSILWNGEISLVDPLEGDIPRFMSVQVPEGLGQVKVLNETKQTVSSDLIPISSRVIHVISD